MSLSEQHADLPSLLDTIEYGEQIPALPAGVPELLRALTTPDIAIGDLNGHISRFPSISSRLIFLANSAWSAPAVPIASLEVACSKLGLTLIRSVCLAMSIAAPFNPVRCSGFDSNRYWLSALLVANTSRQLGDLSPRIANDDLSVLQTVGLLHNIGLLWLADRFPILTSAALKDVEEDDNGVTSINESLQSYCRTGYAEVGGRLAEAWELPSALILALKHHNDPAYRGDAEHLAHTVGLATKVADALMFEVDPETLEFAQAELLGIDPKDLADLIRVQQGQLDNLRELVTSYLASS